MNKKISPSELIVERNRAFEKGDFGFIFDTFHSESNFRRQFPEREEYIIVGESSLILDFQILDCKILHERILGDDAQVIFLMEMMAQGTVQKYAELAWLKTESSRWCYHRGLKVTQEDLPESLESLTFEFFESLDQSTAF